MNFSKRHFAFTTAASTTQGAVQKTKDVLQDVGVNNNEMSHLSTEELTPDLFQVTMQVSTAYMTEFDKILDGQNAVEDIEEVAVETDGTDEDDCGHGTLELVNVGGWADDHYYDEYHCLHCDAVFFETFETTGFVDEHGDDFSLDGRELR